MTPIESTPSAVEELLDLMQSGEFSEQFERARELQDHDVPDVYVFTDQARDALRAELATEDPTPFTDATLIGVPFESYPTIQEALKRVSELNQEGKSVALIAD